MMGDFHFEHNVCNGNEIFEKRFIYFSFQDISWNGEQGKDLPGRPSSDITKAVTSCIENVALYDVVFESRMEPSISNILFSRHSEKNSGN
ncbi:hypothetical protein TNIN_34561 [Trichonephila inaurata madagascariensis]|uniref:Uncharacterized protein n=1 Tax=Trichonephila inaurata madagascariensis TaxID=2747483 RepID=A0A8X7CRL9_9ARAC|nr:hypothetical protein TNIN_34561 [Trichonephila inaurata madagascariensis]